MATGTDVDMNPTRHVVLTGAPGGTAFVRVQNKKDSMKADLVWDDLAPKLGSDPVTPNRVIFRKLVWTGHVLFLSPSAYSSIHFMLSLIRSFINFRLFVMMRN